MRKLTFQQIADSRDRKNTLKTLLDRHYKLMDSLKALEGVQVESAPTQFLEWKDGTTQYRIGYTVSKDKRTTWEQIMATINSYKAVPYKFI